MRIPTKTSTRGPYNTTRSRIGWGEIARALRTLGFGCLFVYTFAASSAAAQDPGLADPPRYVALASGGVPLRLTVEEDYGQERLGATFVDLLAGYVLPGAGPAWRHGFGVGVSWNLGHDGGYIAPIYTADQIALMPAYLGYLQLDRDLILLSHVGVPIVVRGGVGPGLELGGALLFHIFAGAGVFAEFDLAGFAAGDASVSVLASLEAGVMLNYEVLP